MFALSKYELTAAEEWIIMGCDKLSQCIFNTTDKWIRTTYSNQIFVEPLEHIRETSRYIDLEIWFSKLHYNCKFISTPYHHVLTGRQGFVSASISHYIYKPDQTHSHHNVSPTEYTVYYDYGVPALNRAREIWPGGRVSSSQHHHQRGLMGKFFS